MQLSVLVLVALVVAPAGATYSGNSGTAPLAGGYGLGFNPTYGGLGGFGGFGGFGGLGALGVGFKTTGTFNTGMMPAMEKNLKVTCQKGAMDEGIGITIEEKRPDNIFGAFQEDSGGSWRWGTGYNYGGGMPLADPYYGYGYSAAGAGAGAGAGYGAGYGGVGLGLSPLGDMSYGFAPIGFASHGINVCAGGVGTGYAGKADCRGTVVDCCLLGYDSMSRGLPSA
ncbi:hypothetical protein ACOMHN_002326 [Nucella lapillus]